MREREGGGGGRGEKTYNKSPWFWRFNGGIKCIQREIDRDTGR